METMRRLLARPALKRALCVLVLAGMLPVLGCTPKSSLPRRERACWAQTGKASWYGGAFDGERTASGELFNPHVLSAAHPSLPFGAHVRVTNLDNGRSIVLRINDRGPFAEDRILDVSRRAAHELGFLRRGVAPVRIELLADAP
jgi:rare lipoprotein A